MRKKSRTVIGRTKQSKDRNVGNQEPQKTGNSNPGASIKAPLTFSFAAGVVAGVVTLVSSAGGTANGLRWDLGAIAFGVGFISTLLVASLLVMGHKENPASMGQGSGVSRKSSDRLDAARLAAARAAAASERDGKTPPK